jgi:glycosyltransferase involved in cell wall biosynthesis
LASEAVPSISVVLPAYNEQEALPHTVAGFAAVLPDVAGEWEIVVADDGSVDGTPAVCEALVREYGERFRCVRLVPNQGYGAALAAGIAAARHDWVLLSDSDGQFDPADLPSLVAHAGGSPIVIGHRVTRAEGRRRQFTSGVFNMMARVLFGFRVRDIDCAFKLIDASMVKAVPLTCRRYLVNTEILHAFVRSGFQPVEVGVRHRARKGGESKIGFRDVPRSLLEMFKLRVRLWRAPPVVLKARGRVAC